MRKCLQLNNNFNIINKFDSLTNAAKNIGKPKATGTICKVCKGKGKSYNGFSFMYEEEYLFKDALC